MRNFPEFKRTIKKPPTVNKRRFFETSSQKLIEWKNIALNDKYILYTVIIWLGGIIISLIYTIIFYGKIPPQIPLFYSRIWGPEQLAQKNYLLLLPFGTFLLGIVNLAFGISTYQKNKLVSYLLENVIVIVTLLELFSVINIINLIT